MACTPGSFSDNIEILSSGVYGLLSICLYCYLIFLIKRKSVFHHPFFYQFVLLSITNMVLWLDIFITQRVITNRALCSFLYPRFSTPSLALKPLLIFYYLPLSTQMITVMSISINRMTVLVSPVAATEFWSRHVGKIIFGIIVASLLYSFYLYSWDAYVGFLISDEFVSLSYEEGWPHIPLAGMGAIISLITLAVLFVCGGIGSYFLYRSSLTAVRSAERNLFWTNLSFSLTTGTLSFYLLMIYFFFYTFPNDDVSAFMITIRGWLYDVNCLVPSWLIVVANKQIRQHLLPFKASKVSVSQISRGS